jgi:hypothetical protein
MTNLMSENIDLLALALSKAQSDIENVSKDKQAYGYKYADLGSCLQAIKKPLRDNGLSISQLGVCGESKQMLVTLLMHESGQWLKSVFCLESVELKQCNSLQNLGAGLTYMRRYALSSIIGLTQEDDDAQAFNKKPKPEVKKTEVANPYPIPFVALDKIRILLEEDKVLEAWKLCEAIQDKNQKVLIWESLDSEQKHKLTNARKKET